MSQPQESKIFQGVITLEGDFLSIRFSFSEERFKAIKQIANARFDKEKKRWLIPLLQLPELANTKEFSPDLIQYNFDTAVVTEQLKQRAQAVTEARERFAHNPFSVSEADIDLLEPDIVFKLSLSSSLRAQIKRGSRARRYLEKLPGVHYLRPERCYFFPTSLLTEFLKLLRDKKISFAVEKIASEKLQQGATLRAQLLGVQHAKNQDELVQALLVPYLAVASETGPRFHFEGWTTEQLRDCLPDESNFTARKAHAKSLSSQQAAQLIYRAKAKGHKVWVTHQAHSALLQFATQSHQHISENGFEESILALEVPHACWATTIDGRGCLLLSNDYFSQFLKSQKQLWRDATLINDPRFTHHKVIPWRDSLLRKAFQRFQTYPQLGHIPFSKAFHALLLKLLEREKQLAENSAFHDLKDSQEPLIDTELQSRLFAHQRVAVQWLLKHTHGILGDDMGLGKTLSILAAAQELFSRGEIQKVLIVCPNSLVKNWLREAQHWTKKLRLLQLPNEKRDREKFLVGLRDVDNFEGIVVNFETARLEYVYPLLKELYSGKRSLLCIDESQRIKNPQSKAFVAIKNLSEVFSRRFLLSGTPTPKDLSDIWGQMLIVDRGERFGTQYYEWLASVAELGNKYSEVAVKRFIPEQVSETIIRVHEVLLRRRKEEVINLPEKLFSIRDLELSAEQQKRYSEVCEELLLRITSLNGKEFIRSIENLLEQYLRAVQVASNPRLIDPSWKGDPVKFVELDSIIQEVVVERGEKIVVWTNYLANVEELVARYSPYGSSAFSGSVSAAERQRTVERFQDENDPLKVLIAIPAAGGVGITLTAAQTAVYIDKTWNAEHWMQSVDRIHRIGQKGVVSIVSLHAGKVDEIIAYNVRRKEKMQARLLQGVEEEASELYPTKEELLAALRG